MKIIFFTSYFILLIFFLGLSCKNAIIDYWDESDADENGINDNSFDTIETQ
jgi:hypothetical protein